MKHLLCKHNHSQLLRTNGEILLKKNVLVWDHILPSSLYRVLTRNFSIYKVEMEHNACSNTKKIHAFYVYIHFSSSLILLYESFLVKNILNDMFKGWTVYFRMCSIAVTVFYLFSQNTKHQPLIWSMKCPHIGRALNLLYCVISTCQTYRSVD